MDPLERGLEKIKLGWFYNALRNGYYLDEIYQATFVRGTKKLADIANYKEKLVDSLVTLVGRASRAISSALGWIDREAVDGAVNLVGRGGVSLSLFSEAADNKIVDGLVDGFAEAVDWVGANVLRPIQTGKVQNYLLVVLTAILTLLGFYLAFFYRIPN
jgi:NADH-quinone oxidoreductase subunit L